MKYIPLIGRILFSGIFLFSFMNHFSPTAILHAAISGVPDASLLVPLSGILAIAGALSICIGYKAKWGAWLLVLFLIPVTFYMHAFWKETDPKMHQMQFTNFLKNISMLGGALMIAYFGSGPFSIDRNSSGIKKTNHDQKTSHR